MTPNQPKTRSETDPDAQSGVALETLAEMLGCEWDGDGALIVNDVAALDRAGPRDIAFVRSPRLTDQLASSRAGAVIIPREMERGDHSAIYSDNPALDFARVVARVRPRPVATPGIDPSASVATSAHVDPSAEIGAGVTIGARSRVGARCLIHARVAIYPDVVIGDDCELHSHVVVREECELGDRVVLQPGVVIGGDGFGYVPDGSGLLCKVPQVGRVILEDDVEIGANSTVDRATLSETRVRRGAKIDNLVQIGHNCDVGEDVLIAAQSGLGGSTEVGKGAFLMAQMGASGHLRIGDRAFVGARTGIHRDIADGARAWGFPQMEERRWHRVVAAMNRLPTALKRLRAIEAKLGIKLPSRITSKTTDAKASPDASQEPDPKA
jgi:UDP-3-O-[3-hydroxymyristoyl] glucosamine N-acyltransferase